MLTSLEKLNLPSNASELDVKTRWRELASGLHPDKGGDANEFHEMRQAYNEALELVKKPVRCDVCSGKGKVPMVSGFNTITVLCEYCNGKGTIKR